MTSRPIRPAAGSRCESITLATRICAHCPVRAECRNYALCGADTCGGIASGIWGCGVTSRERAQLQQQHRMVAA